MNPLPIADTGFAPGAHATGSQTLLIRFRSVFLIALWPWLGFVLTLILMRTNWNWNAPTWGTLRYLYLVSTLAVAVKVLAPSPSRGAAVVNGLFAFVLLSLTQFLVHTIDPTISLYQPSASERIYWQLLAAINIFYPVALGALVAAVTSAGTVRWVAVLLSPMLLWPVWAVFVTAYTPEGMVMPPYYFLFALIQNPYAGLVISVPAAIVAAILWRPRQPGTQTIVQSRATAATSEILAKEFRLQKSNIAFILATVLLGGLGILSVNAADPSVASFSADDIRDALFTTALLPLLSIILPIMVGSTAAAGEKPLGVHAWQAALPISLWRATGLKLLVIAIIIFFVSGVLPYLLQFTIPNSLPLSYVFRHTWPVWLGLLCAAVGFYSGTLARDDYQGLLISAVPVLLLVYAMIYADPMRLVFPAFLGWQEPIWKEHFLALRLLIIAAGFVIAATAIQRRPGQRRLRLVLTHAVALMLLTFICTLCNVVTERRAFQPPNRGNMWHTAMPHVFNDGTFAIPQPIATLAGPVNFRPYHANMSFDESSPVDLPQNIVSGKIARSYGRESLVKDNPSQAFLLLSDGRLREFPQALEANVVGCSPGGSWLLAEQKDGRQILCGPAGFSIDSALVPDAFFQAITRLTSVWIPLDHPTVQLDRPIAGQPSGRNFALPNGDLQVSVGGNRAITVLDGAELIPGLKNYHYNAEWESEGIALHTLPWADAATTRVAILKPINRNAEYELVGWAGTPFRSVTSDLKWATTENDRRQITLRQLADPRHPEQAVTGEGLKEWKLPAVRTQNDGTTVTLIHRDNTLQIINVNGSSYVSWIYNVHGPVTIGNRTAHGEMKIGMGALLLNLETGKEVMVPFNFPWRSQHLAALLQGYREGREVFINQYHSPSAIHPEGPIAIANEEFLIVADPLNNDYEPGSLIYTTAVIPSGSITGVHFLGKHELAINDLQTIYHVRTRTSHNSYFQHIPERMGQ